MRNKLYALVCFALLFGCSNPLKDLEIQVNTDVIHYSALMEVQDGKGNPVSDLIVNITGDHADNIYTLAGSKTFTVQSGMVGVGVHPKFDPEPNAPVNFNVQLSGADYITQTIPVSLISDGRKQQVMKTNVLRLSDPPSGVSVNKPVVAIVSGANTFEFDLATQPRNNTTETTTITVPVGTRFQDASGNTIPGNRLNTVIAHVDPSKESALSVFPGCSLVSDNVLLPGQGQQTGTFVPAALANIDMKVGTTDVRTFSQPVIVTMQLDPAFTNQATGAPVQAGDVLDIFSNQPGSTQWSFEKTATVAMIDGKLSVRFETDHLTWYFCGNFVRSCQTPQSFVFSGSWMNAGLKYPMTIDAMVGGRVVASTQADISTKENTVTFKNLPDQGVVIRVKNMNNEILASRLIPAGCPASTTITVNRPSVVNRAVTMQLYVRCPNNKVPIGVLPTFYLYYRVAKPTSDLSEYKFLGVVEKGFISTSLLTPGTVTYDFKAVWGENVKYAHKKIVAADNTTTVGDGSGEIIGEIDPQNNLEMLTEKCKEFGL